MSVESVLGTYKLRESAVADNAISTLGKMTYFQIDNSGLQVARKFLASLPL